MFLKYIHTQYHRLLFALMLLSLAYNYAYTTPERAIVRTKLVNITASLIGF